MPIVDLVDRYWQDGGCADQRPRGETVEARLGRLLAIQEPLLTDIALGYVRAHAVTP